MNQDKDKKPATLSELGEFGLIDRLNSFISIQNPETIKGIGDDAAILDFGLQQTIVTKDLLIEGVHFDMVYTPLKHLGYKSVAVNLSDLYAMNAIPRQILVGIAISSKYTLEAIEELYEGMALACKKYGVDLVGGDTTSSFSGLCISITAIGMANPADVVLRSTAEENDLVCVSGDLGAAYAGLLLLKREKEVFRVNPNMQPELGEYDYVLQRQLKPEPRRDITELFKQLDILPTAMIDISDGLASDIMHICKQSGLGCSLFEEKIPIDHQTASTALEFGIDPIICALHGGEDYELLFTIKQADYDKIKENLLVSVIGYMSEAGNGINLITKDSKVVPLTAQGWDALKKQDTSS